MKNKEWQEILKKCFGKEKDDRYHAIAMLAIYGIFILILVVLIRVGGSSSSSLNQNNNSNEPTSSPTTTITPSSGVEEDANENVSGNDINYSYSYTISYNGVSEVYLGKKIDDKEKFTLIKNGITTDYAILSDNYLILENDTYHITETPSKYFKYCDVEEILLLIENEISTENNGNIKYSISNQSISDSFKDTLVVDNEQSNSIQLYLSENVLKSIDLDFSNYLSSVEGGSVTFTIHMEFADVGTTEDFEIKVS